ncbi:CCCH zinc finger DNA binding protein [Aspergillus lentulus]|uniref:CCCH zinc finger DNA binding protein n=1 Tax=Aspergillus lentulus TaxID=293939 RepID=A0ABQ1AEG1_ASPLE|nr:CCCH zinc finger DNA binding protein [Aspergillus lentulus]GFF34825.1 CCCH zinc finger DNA binding protein [Aspergillus lentulus]GFF80171.1 CCCH zinc finger DNA binding protein [Aspergillus lentulus]GFF90814.1 CCCH zinc finger DNA binding protein [Aspergillus lentulus]
MMFDIADVKTRYADVRAVEDSKDKIILDLFSYIEDLTKELQDERDVVDNNKRLIASFKEENRNLENMRETMRRDQAKLSFVSVLVDGDGMNFHGNLVKDGKHGGLEAARLLIQAVQDHIQKVDPEASPIISCKIRVFANVEGLTEAYRNNNVLSAGESLTSFIQGFNQENALCDFVDAGNGKECADVKLRARFEQDINDVHCRRIIFCASADNSHARVLSAHRGSNRISLVKGPPFAQEMEELAAGFKTDSFENVFMSSKLKTTRRVSFSATNTAITPPRTPTPNYASAAKATPPTQSSSLVVSSPAHRVSKLRQSVCVNSRGQRVDHPLRYSSKENVETLKRRKLCNQFHLLGSCPYGNNCTHKHGPSLSATEITDLTHIARSSVCLNGIFCHDVNCVCGHRCPQKTCPGGGCKFPDSMHGVDTNIVKII